MRSLDASLSGMDMPEQIVYSGQTSFGHISEYLFAYDKMSYMAPGVAHGKMFAFYRTLDKGTIMVLSFYDNSEVFIVTRGSQRPMIVDDIQVRGSFKFSAVQILTARS